MPHALLDQRTPGDSIPPSYKTLRPLNPRKKGKEKHSSKTLERPRHMAGKEIYGYEYGRLILTGRVKYALGMLPDICLATSDA